MPNPVPAAATRDRLIAAMSDALQRRGLHGIGLTELLAEAQAPKGVLYHHFPGGKAALAVAAIEAAVTRLLAGVDRLGSASTDPFELLGAWMESACRMLERSAFERGCPLATVALESTGDDGPIRAALASGFAAIRGRLALLLQSNGVAPERAARLAVLVVAAYEGALMQARVAGDSAPMRDTAAALLDLLRLELRGPAP